MDFFKNKTIALFIVETTIPPVSRANLRLFHIAVRLMQQKGFHVHMISPSFMPWTRKTVNVDKIIINQYWGFGYLIYGKTRVFSRAWHLIATVLSVLYLQWYFYRNHKKKISVIHAWNPLAGFAAVIGGKLIGSKVFIDFTDFYSDIATTDLPFFSKVLLYIERYILQNASKIFVVSTQMKNYLRKSFRIPPKKIHIVPDGVDTKAFDYHTKGSDIRMQFGLTEKNPTLIFHGDIKYGDGMDILLDALEIALAQNPKIRLLILGGGGVYFQKLKKRIEKPPLNKAILFLGWVPYELVSKYIGASDIGVMPMRATLNHNLYVSFKLFEYWAMAKPVIVTKLSAIGDIVKNKKNGLIVPTEDPKALANAILFLSKNSKLVGQMGKSGRKLVEDEYNWDILLKKEIAVYKKKIL